MNTTWAYISNYFVYSAMAIYTISFFAHAFETAWAVRAPEQADCWRCRPALPQGGARPARRDVLCGYRERDGNLRGIPPLRRAGRGIDGQDTRPCARPDPAQAARWQHPAAPESSRGRRRR